MYVNAKSTNKKTERNIQTLNTKQTEKNIWNYYQSTI